MDEGHSPILFGAHLNFACQKPSTFLGPDVSKVL